jgi:hypothetical protein
MEIANVFTVECELGMEHEGFRIRETQIGPQLGADLIGGSVYEIDPGKKLWPCLTSSSIRTAASTTL